MRASVDSVAGGVELSQQVGLTMADIRDKAAAEVQVVHEMSHAL